MLSVDQLVMRWPGPAARPVLDGVSLSLMSGEIGVLLGPSGCGKTTLLRVVAGLERPSAGRVSIAGQCVSDPAARLQVPAEKRRIGMVFQDFALFPHLTVAGNVAFGLRHLGRTQRHERVARMLALVGLDGLAARWPHQLSGGQQQRVALARALAPAPDLILLDEPFSSLDTSLRERLVHELRDILKATGTTALFVTHDQAEAFALGDKVGVMHQGQLHQWDAPRQLYRQPASRFVAEFIGQGVLLPSRWMASHDQPVDTAANQHASAPPVPAAAAPVPAPAPAPAESAPHDLLLRASDVALDPDSSLRAEVLRWVYRGADALGTLRLSDGQVLYAELPPEPALQAGQEVGIRLAPQEVVTFARQAQSAA
ncbi:ABC transporter ATP-binding protein [Aquabacterium lacunae]|uniref:ABC transporter ATP-binding protein n=2 Tax=Aquabacterium lacunae TaxID=2528630 RepID=A0A4Q9H2Z4_9BURK|nr:ABC transporter ATP-binding protein [Aquabacterium lacunae]